MFLRSGVLEPGVTFCAFGSLPGLTSLPINESLRLGVCFSPETFHESPEQAQTCERSPGTPGEEFARLGLGLEHGVWGGSISSLYLIHLSPWSRFGWDFY